ncbi:hypothetical protein F5148DRAFT_1327290 [Russula earlei]|uniref:Uncharacterized protein n=2 Tax=Russula earlei TaxID=71964 RepID=A0ACC0U168_9AGAM|nr:hypothetical protein F5148DRAFT_1348852 [Russula earlei]KAI9454109.1 hypothetical protein F5148DRAFT_1327290 [Russula earlei]
MAWLTAENALNGSTTLGTGWRAGQHVHLRVVSRAWFGWWATWLVNCARPFTIAAGSDSSGMMLPVKAQGSWTHGLLHMSGDVVDAHPEKEVHQHPSNMDGDPHAKFVSSSRVHTETLKAVLDTLYATPPPPRLTTAIYRNASNTMPMTLP